MSDTTDQPFDDPDLLFDPDGPINPLCVTEAVRTLMRAMPLGDDSEPADWSYRRMYVGMRSLGALNPRDEIELLLGVQALCAYQAAAALWRVGMNVKHPHGDSTRHISAAGSAVRTFDSLLKAIERRQAKPLAIPPGRPAPRMWARQDPAAFVEAMAERCRNTGADPEPFDADDPEDTVIWSPEAIAEVDAIIKRERIERENRGLDIANTEGIQPDGSIIMPECPTPQQKAYIARRLTLRLRREWEENKRNGKMERPKIRPLRTGDLVP